MPAREIINNENCNGENNSIVMGAYGRGELIGNGESLLAFAGEHKLAPLKTFFATLNAASRTLSIAPLLENTATV